MLKQKVGASPCLVSAENGSQDSIPFVVRKNIHTYKTCQSITSIDLGVTNKYQWVDKFTNTESIFKNTEFLDNGHQ